jgi:hypothetical protein
MTEGSSGAKPGKSEATKAQLQAKTSEQEASAARRRAADLESELAQV